MKSVADTATRKPIGKAAIYDRTKAVVRKRKRRSLPNQKHPRIPLA